MAIFVSVSWTWSKSDIIHPIILYTEHFIYHITSRHTAINFALFIFLAFVYFVLFKPSTLFLCGYVAEWITQCIFKMNFIRVNSLYFQVKEVGTDHVILGRLELDDNQLSKSNTAV